MIALAVVAALAALGVAWWAWARLERITREDAERDRALSETPGGKP